ncbi:MAG: DNA-binding response regulator [Eubacteriales bacterium]
MFRVIIIENTQSELDRITREIKWENLDATVVGTSLTYAKAEENIKKLHPDIILTETLVEGGNALDLLGEAIGRNPNLMTVVHTERKEFDFAQKAMEYGVRRYMVKPSPSGSIFSVLDTLIKQEQKKWKLFPFLDERLHNATEQEMSNSFIVRRAIVCMEEHYAEKISLPWVAEQCFISQWHLSKLINRHTGLTFYDILNTIRVEQAIKLLDNANMRIIDISEQVGYADVAHFSRIFKKQTGMTTMEFRRKFSN